LKNHKKEKAGNGLVVIVSEKNQRTGLVASFFKFICINKRIQAFMMCKLQSYSSFKMQSQRSLEFAHAVGPYLCFSILC